MELTLIKGVGPKTVEKLNALGIFCTEDAVEFYPKYYFDMTRLSDLQAARQGDYVLLKGEFSMIGGVYRANRGLNLFRATLKTAEGQKIKLVWFNAPFVRAQLQKETQYLIWGKVNRKDGGFEISNPSFELADGCKRLTGIVPIYPLKGVIAQNTFRSIVAQCLSLYEEDSLLDGLTITDFRDALGMIHNPATSEERYQASARLALEQLTYQLIAYRICKRNADDRKPRTYALPYDALNSCVAGLPYRLTPSQASALREIVDDLRGGVKTNRMLLGDVGSGKTAVALLSVAYAVKCGFQAALLCPTEILANQHFDTAMRLLEGRNIACALLTGSTPTAQKKRIAEGLQKGEIDFVIGTHAVLGDKIAFARLGFIVIDELHRFGVRQKSALEDKTVNADVLIMSATPIPRTLALSLYGDLAQSQLLPREGTGANISTYVISDAKLEGLYSFIAERVSHGEQAYIVCPLVEDCEGLEVYSAKQLYRELAKDALAHCRIGLIHGGMRESAKKEVMNGFYRADIDVLVATSVIEVGIDSPRASVIAVLNADRFGLAALHQLRGRVGRSAGLRSYCFLHTSLTEENQRLQALKENRDGAAIAEIDASIRGYGDFLGIRQSGGGTVGISKGTILNAKELTDRILRERTVQVGTDRKLSKYLTQMQGVSLT